VGWYNVENLFDNEDDSRVRDEEFAADGAKEYTPQLYRLKVQRVAKVLGWLFHQTGAVAVGLCEVENNRVLDDLLRTPPLDQFSLWRVHRDSPDPRGIDVAVLYRTDCVRVENASWVLPRMPDERGTREAVVVTLVPRSAPAMRVREQVLGSRWWNRHRAVRFGWATSTKRRDGNWMLPLRLVLGCFLTA
jgi:hypothetical protein